MPVTFARPESKYRIAIVVGLARLVLPLRRDLIVSECSIRRECERPFGTAPISNLDASLVDVLVLAVARRDVDDRSGSEQLHPRWRIGTQDRLEVDLLSEPIDSAIGEHRSSKNRLRLAEIQAVTEVVRSNALMPIATEVCRVAVLFGDDDEFEVPELGSRTARRNHRSVAAGCFFPSHGVRAIDERVRARQAPARRCRVE